MVDAVVKKLSRLKQLRKKNLEKMGKITRNSSKKNEEVIPGAPCYESESEFLFESEEEEESDMEVTESSGDEDFVDVSNIFVIIYIHII